MAFRIACREEQLWEGEKAGFLIDGRKVLLVNVAGSVHAYEDRCAHLGWPLSLGKLTDGQLTCTLHQWRYDACTGAGINPRGVALKVLPIDCRDGHIWVDVDG